MKGRRWEVELLFARRRRGDGRGNLALLGSSDEVGGDVEPLLVEAVDGDFYFVLSKS